MLNKQIWTANKGWIFTLWVENGSTNTWYIMPLRTAPFVMLMVA